MNPLLQGQGLPPFADIQPEQVVPAITELLTQVKLLIVPRTGNHIESHDLQILTDLGAKISIAPLTTPPISSTIIRQSHSIQGLTPKVATYIQHHHLYSNSDDSKQIK